MILTVSYVLDTVTWADLPHYKQQAKQRKKNFFSMYNVTILSRKSSIIPLGCKLEIPPGFYLQLKTRSSMGIKGLIVIAGVIDCDFRGQPLVIMHNLGKLPVKIKRYDKFVQGIILESYSFPLIQVEELGPSIRAERGLGSSGY